MPSQGSKPAPSRRSEQIRELARSRAGRVSISEIYQALLVDDLRDIQASLDWLLERGELVEEKGGYLLVEKADNRKREAFRLLWRGAHQLSYRGAWSTTDLAQVSGVSPRGVKYWVAEMKKRGLIEELGATCRYRVAKKAPHRDDPPLFRWPRRGKAKTSRDQ